MLQFFSPTRIFIGRLCYFRLLIPVESASLLRLNLFLTLSGGKKIAFQLRVFKNEPSTLSHT